MPNSGQCFANAGIIGDVIFFVERHVKVHPNEGFFVFKREFHVYKRLVFVKKEARFKGNYPQNAPFISNLYHCAQLGQTSRVARLIVVPTYNSNSIAVYLRKRCVENNRVGIAHNIRRHNGIGIVLHNPF